MKHCAVISCGEKRKISHRQLGDSPVHIAFHKFPKTPAIRKIWIEKCGRSEKFNPEKSYICSEHFTKNDYESPSRAKLIGDPQFKKRLKKAAVPSLALEHVDVGNSTNVSELKLVNSQPDCLDTSDSEQKQETLSKLEEIINFQVSKSNMTNSHQMDVDKLGNELKTANSKLLHLVLEYENLKEKSEMQEAQIKSLQRENSALKKRLFALQS